MRDVARWCVPMSCSSTDTVTHSIITIINNSWPWTTQSTRAHWQNLKGKLQPLHNADDDAVNWLKTTASDYDARRWETKVAYYKDDQQQATYDSPLSSLNTWYNKWPICTLNNAQWLIQTQATQATLKARLITNTISARNTSSSSSSSSSLLCR